jgi:hypothetical protein
MDKTNNSITKSQAQQPIQVITAEPGDGAYPIAVGQCGLTIGWQGGKAGVTSNFKNGCDRCKTNNPFTLCTTLEDTDIAEP